MPKKKSTDAKAKTDAKAVKTAVKTQAVEPKIPDVIEVAGNKEILISAVDPGERYREEFGDIESLAMSMTTYGQLHPIVLDEDNKLIAGERRLKAAISLKWEYIKFTRFADCSEIQKREMEMEENLRRKAFTWQEEVKAVKKLDELKRSIYGSAKSGSGNTGEGWSLRDTARQLGVSAGTTSESLKLALALEQFPELTKEKNKSAAMRKYTKITERILQKEIASRATINVQIEYVHNADCISVMQGMKAESVNLCITDPPWGVNIDNSGMLNKRWETDIKQTFGDDTFDAMELMRNAFKEIYRILSPDSHCYIFFAMRHYEEVKKYIIDAGFYVDPTPLLWNKELGVPLTVPTTWVTAYEPIFFCVKGNKVLNVNAHNVLTYKRVPPQKKINPTQKPVSLLRKLIETSSTVGDFVFDPFMGSASTLIAAYESRRSAGGVELGKDMYTKALARICEYKERFAENTVKSVDIGDETDQTETE